MRKMAFALVLASLASHTAYALGCPLGISNDSYPGQCNGFTDGNRDGLCDFSESEQVEQASTTSTMGDAPPNKPKASTATSEVKTTTTMAYSLIGFLPSLDKGRYDFINLSVAMLAVYGTSFLLYRSGKISVRAHRMVWNVLLLFTFLVCAVLGVLLVLQINYGYVVKLPVNMLYWHVEAGIAMTLISVFHILWHMEYFKSILRARATRNSPGARSSPQKPKEPKQPYKPRQ
jgi:hypothetical protein